jgi:hypothetical protein
MAKLRKKVPTLDEAAIILVNGQMLQQTLSRMTNG